MKKAAKNEPECPMCQAGVIGRNHTKEITLGKHGALERAVEFFKMTPLEVMDHCNTHEIKIDENTGVMESNDFYMDRILKMMTKMDAWFAYLDSHSTDREAIKLGLAICREMRMTTESLAEFQGRLDRKGNVNVQIETLNMEYKQLTVAIMDGVCDECKTRIINHLNTQRNVIPADFKEVSPKTLVKECTPFSGGNQIQSGGQTKSSE